MFFADGKTSAGVSGQTVKVAFYRRGLGGTTESIAEEADLTRHALVSTIEALSRALTELDSRQDQVVDMRRRA
ncbi:hypothetical protein [Euryhalocaulis caribicus]|uniref:hypothetical protein n=1 Tax=Euryhalocaulis caribicus TaxID=1161401 RepID=UPI0003B3E556|nr:hypothetical protein [Euryhalocaulis caribicus]